jgi:hypothetical protein
MRVVNSNNISSKLKGRPSAVWGWRFEAKKLKAISLRRWRLEVGGKKDESVKPSALEVRGWRQES